MSAGSAPRPTRTAPARDARGSYRTSIGYGRPGTSITGQSSRKAATGPASSVADITRSRRSSRARHACRAKASARSAWRLRSWNSSSTIVRKPLSSGSDWSRRVRMPSVATSRRVSLPKRRSKRTCQPTSLSERPALLLGDSARDRPGRDPPRLQQEDGAVADERRRHPRRLARPRRRDEDGGARPREGVAHARDVGVDGEGRAHALMLPCRAAHSLGDELHALIHGRRLSPWHPSSMRRSVTHVAGLICHPCSRSGPHFSLDRFRDQGRTRRADARSSTRLEPYDGARAPHSLLALRMRYFAAEASTRSPARSKRRCVYCLHGSHSRSHSRLRRRAAPPPDRALAAVAGHRSRSRRAHRRGRRPPPLRPRGLTLHVCLVHGAPPSLGGRGLPAHRSGPGVPGAPDAPDDAGRRSAAPDRDRKARPAPDAGEPPRAPGTGGPQDEARDRGADRRGGAATGCSGPDAEAPAARPRPRPGRSCPLQCCTTPRPARGNGWRAPSGRSYPVPAWAGLRHGRPDRG